MCEAHTFQFPSEEWLYRAVRRKYTRFISEEVESDLRSHTPFAMVRRHETKISRFRATDDTIHRQKMRDFLSI